MTPYNKIEKLQAALHTPGTPPLSHEAYLNAVVTALPELIEAERCSIFIRDPAHERLWLHCGTGMIERELDLPLRGSVGGEVVYSGKSKIIQDLSTHTGNHTDVEILTGFKTRNILCVPVRNSTDEKVRGVIQILNKRPGVLFQQEDLTLVETVANMIKPMISRIYHDQSLYTTQSLHLNQRRPTRLHRLLRWLLMVGVTTALAWGGYLWLR